MHVELRGAEANPFVEHPEFRLIWPTASSRIAQEATAEALENGEEGVFVIHADGTPVGMTGYFDLESADQGWWGLRWHGLVAQHRGKGISEQALGLVAGEILNRHASARMLVEYIPLTDYSAYLFRYFEGLGFSAVAPPEHVDWAPHRIQAHGINLHRLRQLSRHAFVQ
ncbi:GNAT family N-acetyltransferase [Achromobacter xylosoxidans]